MKDSKTRQPQQIARELVLLSLSQLPVNPKTLTEEQFPKLVLGAVRTLRAEVQDSLENAEDDLNSSNKHLLTSETRAADLNTSRTMLKEAIEFTRTAINKLGATLDFPELIQLANQDKELREHAIKLVKKITSERQVIDEQISAALVDWQVKRLAQIDRDILRIAVTEMEYYKMPSKIAINEAVELAKRYSGEDGHRFINGVLRRVIEQKKVASEHLSANSVSVSVSEASPKDIQ
ncbi:MAG: transcription antitermination factor NusB [Cyanobacteriota bacterium]|nr:transcription antitermination factor NusB [Cyanobacteriota bacterium]